MNAQPERTFEADMERLAAIVAALEANEVGLDAAVALYEEGCVLAKRLTERLNTAELRVQELAME
ncbi:MAG: exodeoxyribonuclease VII small subunit [Bacteroidota bacterium]